MVMQTNSVSLLVASGDGGFETRLVVRVRAKIILAENGVNLCDGKCSIKLEIKFETIVVEVDESEFELD